MVPLGALVRTRETFGPDRVGRYNAFLTADVNGSLAPGVSSGQGVALMERLAEENLPRGMGFEWTELTFQQVQEGATLLVVFPLSILLAFLVLAAQYESWSLPLVVILIVPLSVLAAMGGVWLTKGDSNIFTQVGLVVLAALACKNAILIVEFARELELQGKSILGAALEACRLRLRPILMTSFAFIGGVTPLVISSGAGSEIRRALGIAVRAGMLGVTIFGLFLTPVLYVVIRSLVTRRAPTTIPK
jgi:multidrug efflux pump